ncbi:hypothetical protein F5Y10DRAFT_286461 [Nemania abortiva]|nr:hypothetical protein F5Y10DRAFT_286461 [Nemania abortiva]
MSPTGFQKYLEVMNRQSLGKKPEHHRNADVLLPHQRTGPIENPLAILESKFPNPKDTDKEEIRCDSPELDTSAVYPKASTHANKPLSKYLSPEYNRETNTHQNTTHPSDYQSKSSKLRSDDSDLYQNRGYILAQVNRNYDSPQKETAMHTPRGITTGLEKSRWAGPSYKNTPFGKASQPAAIYSTPIQNRQPGIVEKQAAPSFCQSTDKPPHQKLVETHASLTTNKADTPEFGQIERTEEYEADPRRDWPTELGANIGQAQTQKDSSYSASSSTRDAPVPPYITDFIKTWIQGAHKVEADFMHQKNHTDCDIDTHTGVFMKPIEYPKTRCQELMSRAQCEQTSELFMRQFIAEIARRDPSLRAERKAAKQARAAAMASEAGTRPLLEEPPNPNEVRIPCHLRPAIESDVEAITDIYNQEIADGYKVMDTNALRQEDFYKVYVQCVAEKAPFVVAVEGQHEAIGEGRQEVIGFALVTAVNLGITGSYDTLSRCGGKLLVIVKPEYRRKKIGTALIDILITNCTGWYMPKGGYQFVNFTNDWISTEFGNKSRKWWYLQMEVIIRSGADEHATRQGEEFQWIWNFLESKFDLLLKHYDEKCLCDPRQMKWLDKLTFRRDCRTLGK